MAFSKSGSPVSAVRQKTLRSSVHCDGITLHKGVQCSLTIKPAEIDHGIIFKRSDVEDYRSVVKARWDKVVRTAFSTTVSNDYGVEVSTIEHLIAALAGCEIDNALIEIDSSEVPIMDGSSQPFVSLIEEVGVQEQSAPRWGLKILRPISVSDGECRLELIPAFDFSIDFKIDFKSEAITECSLDIQLVNGTFNKSISGARTFGFLEDVDQMRAVGLGLGGSLENVVVVDGANILNEGGLRFKDEFVRHKILDCVGDFYLVGGPMLARVNASKTGHSFNNRVLRALFALDDAWEWVKLSESQSEELQIKQKILTSA